MATCVCRQSPYQAPGLVRSRTRTTRAPPPTSASKDVRLDGEAELAASLLAQLLLLLVFLALLLAVLLALLLVSEAWAIGIGRRRRRWRRRRRQRTAQAAGLLAFLLLCRTIFLALLRDAFLVGVSAEQRDRRRRRRRWRRLKGHGEGYSPTGTRAREALVGPARGGPRGALPTVAE